jgi:hypothetical protein
MTWRKNAEQLQIKLSNERAACHPGEMSVFAVIRTGASFSAFFVILQYIF